MAVRIRLKRMGKKKQPIYKIVAADSRAPRDGKYIEAIGYYNPKKEPPIINIKEEVALKWLRIGAQPTETVRSLFSKQGIMMKFALEKDKVAEEKRNEIIEKWKQLKAEMEAKKIEKKKKKNKKKQKEGAAQ